MKSIWSKYKGVVCIIILLAYMWGVAWAADTALTSMTNDASPTDDDIIYSVNDPGGTPADRKVTWANLWVYVYGKITSTIGASYDTSAELDALFAAKQNTISFGTNVETFLGTASSTNLASALTDETGSGAAVFANAPTFTGEVTFAINGVEFQETDTITDCSSFATTGGGIFYDDSEGKFKKCQDNVLSDLDNDTVGALPLNDINDADGTLTLDSGTYDHLITLGLNGEWRFQAASGHYLSIGNIPITGTHDGSNNAATLSDSTASFDADLYIGTIVYNTTDGSSCSITDNDATTVTCTLSGGTDNDWDTGDAYSIAVIKLTLAGSSEFNAGPWTTEDTEIFSQTGKGNGDYYGLGTAYDLDGAAYKIMLAPIAANNPLLAMGYYLGGNYWQIDADSGALVPVGTGYLQAGGVVLGDSTPDADGEYGYASNAYAWFANSEDMTITFSSNMLTFNSNTGAAFTFTPAVTVTGLLTPSGGVTTLTPVSDDPDNFASNFTGANVFGGTFIANAAGTAVQQPAAAGQSFTIINGGSNAVTLDPDASGTEDTFVLVTPTGGYDSTVAQGGTVSTSTSGAMCVVQYLSADHLLLVCDDNWAAD